RTTPGYKYSSKGYLDFYILKEGDAISIGDYLFKCIETPGHTPGHMCLYEPDKKIFISGDHILSDITPNISLFSNEENPLKEYLISLDKVYNFDFHTHVFPPQIKKNRNKYIDSDPCFAILYSKKDANLATADELIASMDKDGIDVSVIANIGWTTHELCVETNDYILESIARYPHRLIGFCSVQPNSYEAAIAEIERCAKEGIKGVGEMRPDMQLFDLMDKEAMEPLVEVVRKHELTLLIHASEPVGHDYPGKGSITPDILYP
ncbi:unnamed protein product, partial [marine sediment metagenome]